MKILKCKFKATKKICGCVGEWMDGAKPGSLKE
jgi:hypothetical protein